MTVSEVSGHRQASVHRRPFRNDQMATLDVVDEAKKVIAIEIEALQFVSQKLGPSFVKAVDLLLVTVRKGRKIIVTGIGKSGHIGTKIAATLTSTGAPSVVLDTVNAAHGDLGIVSRGDAVLALSYSGETEELVRIVPYFKRMQARVIAITGNPSSTLGQNAEVVLDVCVPKEACPLNLAPTSSTMAMLAVGDALAMVLLQRRGFRREDFARFHPGGNIGRNLLLRVQDIMRPLERVPVLPQEASVKEALRDWNAKRAGAAVVVDDKGKVIGIFTHGDFVRGYELDPGIGELPLGKVMTRNPVTVRVDKLAVEVLHLFQTHRVDDLIVVDGKRFPVGMVDTQDLTRHRLL
ncbi:KpsF/GutQ family sugar-phosphate isomerase [Candidatus Methylacidithermus pantelleriae]|uniref:Arabinose 5-phosphate isomerase KdsD n=1 Tax=Candidatus Methylacidithermus pantelleriae TaxID=2744239 RepID=A0A8J2BNQ7_9BACT|nr:KpsF/GutQ family sugar-phosphate isomerase [Candidatus Methylacidithermus pantelleriae]CAF0702358.1 Arabinose 5-phosphate isomerase KdsD [Candidatus Methylacidithermus pantelleriae]